MNQLNTFWRFCLPLCLVACIITGCGQQDDNSQQIIDAHLKRSLAYQKQGQYKAALIEARNIVKKDPTNTIGHIVLAKILLDIGNSRAAISALEPISKQSTDPSIQVLLARAYFGTGKFYSARTALKNYIKQHGNPEDTDYIITRANTLSELGEREEAIQSLQKLMQNEVLSYEAQKALATLQFKSGDLSSAAQQVDELLRKNTEDPEVLYLASQLAYLKNDLDLAEKHLSNALISLPSSDLMIPLRAKILTQLSTVLTAQGRSSEALIYSRLLAAENPELHEAKMLLTEALEKIQEDDLGAAEQLLSKLNSDYPTFEPGAIYLGLVNVKQGKFNRADKLLTAHLDPEISSPSLISASVLNKLRLNQVEDSIALLLDALKVHPDNDKLLALYGAIAINQPKYQKHAALALEKAIAINPDNVKARLPLARYYLDQGKTERGLAQLEQSMKTSPEDAEVVANYAAVMLERSARDKARSAIEHLLSLSPDDPRALNLAARFAAGEKSYERAGQLFSKILEKAPDDFDARKGLADVAIASEDFDTAIKRYTALIKSAPDRAEGYKGLIIAYELKQAPSEGVDIVRRLADPQTATSPAAAYVLAEYYLNKRSFRKAAEYFNSGFGMESESKTDSPLGATIHFSWARELLSAGKLDQARQNLITALNYSPNQPRIMGTLAELEIRAERYDEATRVIAEISQAYPKTAQAELLEGKLAESQNESEKSLAAYRRGWDKQPTDLSGQLVYRSLNQSGQKPAALTFLDEWISKLPASRKARLLKATHLQLAGELQQAETLYQRLLVEEPGNAMALNNLAWLYDSKNDDRAVLIAQRAHEAAPDNGEIMDTYGWLLYKSGEVAEGIALLEQALDKLPNNGEIQTHLKTARQRK